MLITSPGLFVPVIRKQLLMYLMSAFRTCRGELSWYSLSPELEWSSLDCHSTQETLQSSRKQNIQSSHFQAATNTTLSCYLTFSWCNRERQTHDSCTFTKGWTLFLDSLCHSLDTLSPTYVSSNSEWHACFHLTDYLLLATNLKAERNLPSCSYDWPAVFSVLTSGCQPCLVEK